MDKPQLLMPKPEPFIPEKWAKKNCRLCGGTGLIRVHMANPATKKVKPKDNNLVTRPCGCAIKRYQKANPPPLLPPKPPEPKLDLKAAMNADRNAGEGAPPNEDE